MLRWTGRAVLAATVAALALSFAGRWWAPGDSLAVGRIVLAALTLVLAALVRRPLWWTVPSVILALWGGWTVLGGKIVADPPGPVVIYAKNQQFSGTDLDRLADELLTSGAEVILLQEVSRQNEALLVSLGDVYPHLGRCQPRPLFGVAIVSIYPLRDVRCTPAKGGGAAWVEHPQGGFWAVSVHLDWPYPWNQRRSAADVLALIDGLEGPVVVAGDFNMVPWGASVRAIAEAAGGRIIGPQEPSFHLRGIPLPIDHVIAGSGLAEARPLAGSDHRGILARVAPARQELAGGDRPAANSTFRP